MNPAVASAPPVVLQVKPENIPAILKNIDQWVGWKVGDRRPDGRYEKLPVDQRGKVCNAHSPLNWMNIDDALELHQKGSSSGIGFVLDGKPISIHGEDQYIVGIDIDHCVKADKSGSLIISQDAEYTWKKLGQPYNEISPSGTGIRMFVLSKTPVKSGNHDGHEMYVDGRYLTVTGHGKGEIKESTDAVQSIHAEWFPPRLLKSNSHLKVVRGQNATLSDNQNEVEKAKDALTYISADCDRDTWRNLLWALKSTEWECAESIAKEWSETAPERYSDDGFNNVWESYDPDRGITMGTLYHHAQMAGWQAQAGSTQDMAVGDILNGKLFADQYRDILMFIHETGELLIFATAGWVHASPGEGEKCAKAVVKRLRQDAAESFTRDPESSETKRKLVHAAKSSMEPRVRAMISMAQSEPKMTVRLSEFDADPNLLGVENGILDLRTGQLLEVSPTHLVSMRARVAFDPRARCPLWLSSLGTVQPDKSVQRLLQQLVGIFLTGDASLQKLIILYGLGANGKSTYIEIVAWLLGDYGLRIATEMLMHHQRSPQGPSPDIVSLKGRRLAYCNEVEEGGRIDEARVKEHTGGDTLTGRAPYAKQSVTFRPTHNLVMVGNHKPEIHDMSHGMWRRVLLIPFDVTIASHKQDPHLVEKLKAELPGILNWAMAGYRDYRRHGLRIPKVITDATDAYKDEEDLLGEWQQEHCVIAPGAKVAITDCYNAYCVWAKSRGHRALAQSRLSKRLKDRGFSRDAGKRHYLGLELSQAGAAAESAFVYY